jgi:Mg2+/Co2+ transporter CorB
MLHSFMSACFDLWCWPSTNAAQFYVSLFEPLVLAVNKCCTVLCQLVWTFDVGRQQMLHSFMSACLDLWCWPSTHAAQFYVSVFRPLVLAVNKCCTVLCQRVSTFGVGRQQMLRSFMSACLNL